MNKLVAIVFILLFSNASFANKMKVASGIAGEVRLPEELELVSIEVGMNITHCSFGFCPIFTRDVPDKQLKIDIEASDDDKAFLFVTRRNGRLWQLPPLLGNFYACSLTLHVTAQDSAGIEYRGSNTIASSQKKEVCKNRNLMTEIIKHKLEDHYYEAVIRDGKLKLPLQH